jgi:thiamine-monophosphate kinase
MGEFDLIERYFKKAVRHADLGVGDDCALLRTAPGHQLAMSTDMLVEGRHFLSTVKPEHLGHKALAVNLSDLAACGAAPKAFLLSLALPRVEPLWLEGFSKGLFQLAELHGCELIGGDTTQGPLTISITVLGEVPHGQALLRSGARAGDDLYVSGTLGDARLALEAFRGHLRLPEAVFEHARTRMEAPSPRVALGMALRGVATAAADISDGLLGDLGHILKASGVGASIDWPLAQGLLGCHALWDCPSDWAQTCILSGGDDYELVFTAPAQARAQVQAAAMQSQTAVTRIGSIRQGTGLEVLDAQGQVLQRQFHSFDHFATP